MFVRWHKRALAELGEILFQAHERNREETTNIDSAVERTLNTLQMFPKTGLLVRTKGWYEKYMPRTRVILIYRFSHDELAILQLFTQVVIQKQSRLNAVAMLSNIWGFNPPKLETEVDNPRKVDHRKI